MKTSIFLNKKILIIMLAIIILFTVIPIRSNATGLDEVEQGASGFLEQGRLGRSGRMDYTEIKSASDTIYNMLLGIGILIVLVVGSVLGIKFMLSSAEDKAKLKEAIIPFVVGSVIIFGAFGIWKIMATIGNNF